MILPGESISKYRNIPAPSEPRPTAATEPHDLPAAEPASAEPAMHQVAAPSWMEREEMHDRYAKATHAAPQTGESQERSSERAEVAPGFLATEPEQLERAAAGYAHLAEPVEEAPQAEAEAATTHELVSPYAVAASQEDENARRDSESVTRLASQEYEVEPQAPKAGRELAGTGLDVHDEPQVRRRGYEEPSDFVTAIDEHFEAESTSGIPAPPQATNFTQHTAPSVAPEGRTLEHEVLEDDEMEFHPVPENLEALSEVAGDEELVLEEETMDRDSDDYNGRWVPKIADVDEDEVIAAEERGENIFEGGNDEEEEEEEEDDDE
jgi:hypothetical protein